MKMPLSGSRRLRSWASVRVLKTSTPGWLSEVILMMGIAFLEHYFHEHRLVVGIAQIFREVFLACE